MKRKDLLKSKEYWLTEIQLNLFNLIESYCKTNKLNKTDLANKLGVTKGYVSQIMNGDFDHKISKLVELSLTSGKAPIIFYYDLDEYIKEDEENKQHTYFNRHLKPIQINYSVFNSENELNKVTPKQNLWGNLSQSNNKGISKNQLT